MTWVAAGVALVGAYTSYEASNRQADAAENAAASSSLAAKNQSAVQKQMYDQTRADQAPWRGTGEASLNQLAMLMGITPTDGSGGGMGGGFNRYDPTELLGSNLEANEYLYNNDAQYRQLYDSMAKSIPYVTSAADRWDKYGAEWQKKFQAGLDLNALNERMAALYEQERASRPASADPKNNPLFGSLARNFSMQDFEQDPGYGFRQAEGMKAIERSAAARGGLLSGSAMKGIERFGQDLASQEYQSAYNRFQSNQNNLYNRFASLAGVGQTANNALAGAGQNYANAMTGISQANAANQGNALLAAGNARASGYAGIGNAISGAFQNWGQQSSGGYQIPQGYQMGSGYAGNAFATSQGYQPLDHATANAGYYD